MTAPTLRRRALVTLTGVAAAALALTACSSDPADADATASGDPAATADATDAAATDDAETGTWPRTITHEAGDTEVPEEPLTIVSTSITLTGTLLAIDAPVVASAATSVSDITDDQGFFSQWADVATERGVEVLYPDLELDLEAIEALEPDLIVGSTVGADATVDSYDQLSAIAPTILLDYGSSSWEDLAATLGEVTGHEADATAVVEEFDALLADTADAITLPEQPVTALSYNGPDGARVFTATSPQARILTGLGFELAEPPLELASAERSDVVDFTAENLPTVLADSQVAFLVSATDEDVATFTADPLLANAPSVTSGNVVALGLTSFRIDYYSGTDLVELLAQTYGG
ncbi:Fe2+-enterobactin ABC transporter substrate-binding protein [Miniimonas sp. S16]|uniref:Fe2+-enterobactin ABC transporter substrate-binding protein n=1 Tax=Miniimonas sp. S16 TaxID=2171623 RepID=UPI001F22DD13|nr:Fe2+-enterobactin ABC transporter substrate-binding protein [Miniimonas sp. S16]